MKWWLTVVGAVIGLLGGATMLVVTYSVPPSVPGLSELTLQLGIVGVLIIAGAMGGFVIGWLIHLSLRKRR